MDHTLRRKVFLTHLEFDEIKNLLQMKYTHAHILTFYRFVRNSWKFIYVHQLRTSNLGKGVQINSVNLSFIR